MARHMLWATAVIIYLVTTDHGLVSGQVVDTVNGKVKGFSDRNTGLMYFYGIPYCNQPTGLNRFKPPTPLKGRWTDIKDATKKQRRCIQSPTVDPTIESEDCLYLNIYTSDLSAKKPVMVWIHGGSFNSGSGNSFDGSLLVKKGVVVVMINYRLGPLGFMSTGDDLLPGNLGLLDQVEALKWVRGNIEKFGGDKDSVTLFGESAGSASVGLHVMSPLSTGLFKRAIMESGSALGVWAVSTKQSKFQPKEIFDTFVNKTSCTGKNTQEKINCLTSVPAPTLSKIHSELQHTMSGMFLVPTVDGNFLTDYPINILKQKKANNVDTIQGYNSGEWGFVIPDPDNDGISWEDFLTYGLQVFTVYEIKNDRKIMEKIRDIYLNGTVNRISYRQRLNEAIDDMLFALPNCLGIQEESKMNNNKHYLYRFAYHGTKLRTPIWMGIIHAGEIPYVFEPFPDSEDEEIADAVRNMWTNFAKTGNPVSNSVTINSKTVKWTSFGRVGNMLNINKPTSLTKFPRLANIQIYRNLLNCFIGLSSNTNVC